MEAGAAGMNLQQFIKRYVMTDPEWRQLHEEADARRAGARAVMRARLEAGMSQAELAKKVGTGQAVISRIENGSVSPTLDMFTRLARGLGMKPVIGLQPVTASSKNGKRSSTRPIRTKAVVKRKSSKARTRKAARRTSRHSDRGRRSPS